MSFAFRACAAGFTIAAASILSQPAWAAEAIEPTPNGPGAAPGLPPGLLGKPSGVWAKADGAIRGLVSEFAAYRAKGGLGAFRPSNTTLQFTRGRVVVDIVAGENTEALIAELEKLGMKNASHYGNVISGQLPVGVLNRAVELQGLQAISAARQPLINVGDVTSEGVAAMLADQVPAGVDGSGLRIGVLSDSFNQKNGYASGQSSGDMPAGVIVLDDSADCGNPCNDEGRGMMELAYDVAPGANFAFHTAFGGLADFANGIEQLADPSLGDSDVIVDDVFYFAEPMFEDGIVAQAVDTVVAQGVPYFSSAGNFARRSYEADFVDSGEPWYVQGLFGQEYRGTLHDFNAGGGTADWGQNITVNASSNQIITLALQWDQPFNATQVDLDAYITSDGEPSDLYASSADNNIPAYGGNGQPLELLQFQIGPCNSQLETFYGIGCVPNGTNRLVIAYYDGGASAVPGADPIQPTRFKYVLFDRSISIDEYETNSSTLFGHANAAGAQAVGAAFWQATPAWGCDNPEADPDANTYDNCEWNAGHTQLVPQLEYFSSAGGTPIYFDSNGNPTEEIRLKPEIVAPDGANTTFFYSDSSTDADNYPNFFGTSAAAPHAAAVAALMLDAAGGPGSLSPQQVYDALESTAMNMNPRPTGEPEQPGGFDFDTGWGFVQADLAVAAVGGGGDALPSVNLTSPANGATVSGSTVALAANASDDNGVTQVEFFVDNNSLGLGTNGVDGWTATWDSTLYSEGSHTLVAVAKDTADQTASASIGVAVDNVDDPPSVTVTAPGNGATVSGAVSITANASDDRGMTQVEFFLDDTTSLGVDTNGSDGWSASWDSNSVSDGAHTITASATDDADQTTSDSVGVTVENSTPPNDPPVASFTVSQNPCPFQSTSYGWGWVCQFNNLSSDDKGIDHFAWDYGDGTGQNTVSSPTAVYLRSDTPPGIYTVTLTVYDAEGLSDSTSTDVRLVLDAHIAELTDASEDQGRNRWRAVASILVEDINGAAVENAEVFGSWSDGTVGTESCITEADGRCSINQTGLKGNVSPVTLTIQDITNATQTLDYQPSSGGDSIQLFQPSGSGGTTNQPPTAAFTILENPCPYDSVQNGYVCAFQNDSTDDGGVPTATYEWDFGDGTNNTTDWDLSVSRRVLYTLEGTYMVTLTVTDSAGASDSVSHQVQIGSVNNPPTASFTYDCTDLACDFTDTSSDSDGTVTGWSWSFGDGATSTAQNPSHTYPSGSTYTVTLTVTDNDGASSAPASRSVTVSSGGSSITLSANGYKVKGVHTVDLDWGGITGGNVEIYRDNNLIKTVGYGNNGDGTYTDDQINAKGSATYIYRACSTVTSGCSSDVSVVF